MTILIYDHFELEERASKHLRAWKAWHLVLYTLAALSGLTNFIFFQNTIQLVDDNCLLFPRKLEFHLVELPDYIDMDQGNETIAHNVINMTDNAQVVNPEGNDGIPEANGGEKKFKRATVEITSDDVNGNRTDITGNDTHRIMLDTSRTLFENDSNCQFAEFLPILSTIFAVVWMTLFTMCAGGGRSRSGLQEPWSILAPALVFSLVMVILTGHSFTVTNKGMHAFCEAFFNITNTTTCSAVNPYLEKGWNATWGIGGRIAATRAASAGVLAAWACATALLLARCMAAPDFTVVRTGVTIAKDPQQKILRHLKSPKSQRSSQNSPTKRDTISVKSEPTVTTELVSASVEPNNYADSAPSSLTASPVKNQRNSDVIEMTYSPQELLSLSNQSK